ncbi:MAG: DUF2147 domain-containing protein [Acetobacteraceae bacterium]|nr:DUF2147 domain-containing protein [Acetobacteraceae bacterium]
MSALPRRTALGTAVAATIMGVEFPPAKAEATGTPVGLWRTFDDHTGKERGTVRIWDDRGALYGAIVSVRDPAEASKVCLPCRDDRKDQPVIGLNIIRGLKKDGDSWSGGEILDPETGNVYRCSMRLADDGKKLVVRGYIGFALIGRSQTWLRTG